MRLRAAASPMVRTLVLTALAAGLAVGALEIADRAGTRDEGGTEESAQAPTAGLRIEAERRCPAGTRYHRNEYDTAGRVERIRQRRAVERRDGGVVTPYSGLRHESWKGLEREHVVALREAHDSGMCRRPARQKALFGGYVGNLVFATRAVNREKGAGDAAEWLPTVNECWFAARVVHVKRRFDLSVDPEEKEALDGILGQCPDTKMQVVEEGG